MFEQHDSELTVTGARIVNGAGRVANVSTLNLAAGNVEHANGRVSVDGYLRSTSNPMIYVCGDAVPTSPQPGDEVARYYVRKTGPNPDVDVQPDIAVSIFTFHGWDAEWALDQFVAIVAQILTEIDPPS